MQERWLRGLRCYVTEVRRSLVGHGGRIRTVVGVAILCAVAGWGFASAAVSQAAPPKRCQGTPIVGGELEGATKNDAVEPIKRTFDEHGVAAFWGPQPAHEIGVGQTDKWCVGARFGVPAMKVDYRLSNGQEARFQAYYKAVIGGLESSCTISRPTHSGPDYACSTAAVNGFCGFLPGFPRGEGCFAGDVVFRVYRP